MSTTVTTRLHARAALVTAAIAVAMLLLASTNARAEVVRDQRSPSAEFSGLMTISPARIEEDVEPGQATRFQLEVFNDDDEPLDITVGVSDLGPSADPRSLASKVQDGEFGAGEWLSPEISDERLEPFEAIRFDVVVNPPFDAPVGTNLAGVVVRGAPAEGRVGATDGGGFVALEVLAQVFLTIPGPVSHDLRIIDVDVRDAFVLGSQRFVVWELTFQNEGTVNEHVNGSVNVRSIFGNTAHRTKISEMIILRGSRRTARVIWRDLPWVGIFTPDVRVRGDDAKRITHKGERVYVMPWWLPVLVVALVLVPASYLWWRRRQDWKYYLEDEEWDEDWDDPNLVGGR